MTKAHPDINDTLRAEGSDGVRRRHDKSRRYNGSNNAPESSDGEPSRSEKANGESNGAADGRTREVAPFETFDASQWEGQPIEERRWIAHNRIPVGEPGIMSGDGGTGKTGLALQLGVATAAELPDWIGGCVETYGPVVVFSAEEKLAEMHRRIATILAHHRRSFRDLKRRLRFICDQDDVTLARVDRHGILKPMTPLLRLEKAVALIRPALVIIENAADVYAGNENDRANVTRFVRQLLGGLTKPSDATVMLIQHPSVSGLWDGTGRSGSTGWNNAGRWRSNFTKIKDSDERLRQYEVVKNNYGPIGEKVRVRWEKGVFVPESSIPSPERAAADAAIETAFLRCLDIKTAQQISVSPHTGRNYAPAIFEKMREADGFQAKSLGHAMERLLSAGRIVCTKVGPPSKERTVLTRSVRTS
jgi:RecA-family ATPase